MTTHPPHPAGREHGADTQSRFNYQHQVAALYALGLPKGEDKVSAMYLEWHDDFIIVGEDGMLTLVQVKTRDEDQSEVCYTGDLFLGVLKNFLDKYDDKDLGPRISKFILVSERTLKADLVRRTPTSPRHSLRVSSTDRDNLCKGLLKKYPKLSSHELDVRVERVMNLIELDPTPPKRADAMARIKETILNLYPKIGQRPYDYINKKVEALVQEIAKRSGEQHDLLSHMRRNGSVQDVLNETARHRRLTNLEVETILGLQSVSSDLPRRQYLLGNITDSIATIQPHQRASIAAKVRIVPGESILLNEELADRLLHCPLKEAIGAVAILRDSSTPLERILCLSRYFGDDEADNFNQILDADLSSCIGAVVRGRNGVPSGQGYVEAARLTLAPWCAVALDEESGEWSEQSLVEHVRLSILRKINAQSTKHSISVVLKSLRIRNGRVVLVTDGDHSLETIRKILDWLPADARLLWVVPHDAALPPHGLIKLPAPDPEADDGFFAFAI